MADCSADLVAVVVPLEPTLAALPSSGRGRPDPTMRGVPPGMGRRSHRRLAAAAMGPARPGSPVPNPALMFGTGGMLALQGGNACRRREGRLSLTPPDRAELGSAAVPESADWPGALGSPARR